MTEIRIGVLLDRLPRTSLPCIEYSDNVDNIATLPTSFTDYIGQLGKQTKKHAKYYLGRVARDLPQMQFSISEGEDIRKEDYDSITELSKERMVSKYTKYGLSTEEDFHRFLELKRNGLILTASIDGKICAGCVGFLMGDDFYLSKIAHDNDYSKYNLGQVALLKLIEYLIGRKVSRFHFLWCKGVDYKVRFGGIAYPIYNVTYFKSKNVIYFKTKFSLAVTRCIENLKNIVRRNQKIIKLYHKLRYGTK